MSRKAGVTPPPGEDEIVWLRDIEELDYVRASTTTSRRRKGAVEYGTGRSDYYETVGYSELGDEAPTTEPNAASMYTRRVFWLKDPDRPNDGADAWENKTPAEAVDPRTVAPGVRGTIAEGER